MHNNTIELQEIETSLTRVGPAGEISEITLYQPPAPGIYLDMEAEDYHKIDAASASRLKKLLQSPAHLLESIRNPEETDAMIAGSAVHCRVLEPERFALEYAISPKFDRRTKLGKQAAEEFEIENLGKKVIDIETAAMAESIYDSLHSIPGVSQMLSAEGNIEASIFWQDPKTGVDCKSRMDKVFVHNGSRIILDLKTTQDASPEGLSKAIWNYRYDIQGAMYEDAAETVYGSDMPAHFILLACEKTAPFAFRPYRLDNEAIEIGRRETRRLLDQYADCKAKNYWPGYTTPNDVIQSVTLPTWALRANMAE